LRNQLLVETKPTYNMRLTTFLSLCLILICTPLFAQKNFTFGKVSMADVKMNTYEPDTTAGAVILCDIGKFNSTTFDFTRHIRIKILKKSGLDFGNWTFNTPSKSDFKVFVFNLEGGEIIKEKALGNTIYSEDIVDNYKVYKVFAPGVRVGSIIDITYTFPGMPFEWRFQENIPIAYSSITLEPNQYVDFSKSFTGFEKIATISDFEWAAHNMPAFKPEPFLNDYSNYITKFDIQVRSISVPGRFYQAYSTTWRAVVENLIEHPRFGQVLSNTAFLNDFAKELKSKNLSVTDKTKEAYDYVQKNIKWSGSKSLFMSTQHREHFLEDHTGNSAEVNLMLYALLSKAGLTTYPVVLSTRENGRLVSFSPSLDKLNYVVVMVENGDSELILDATSTELPMGMVPAYCLNGYGLLVKKENEQWIELNKKNIYQKKQFVTIDLHDLSKPTAKITQDLSGYAYADWSEEYKENNADLDIQKNEIQKSYPDAKLSSYEIKQNDKAQAKVKEVIELDLSDQIIDTGEEVLFNPLSFLEYSKNPFKSESRKFPIDLTYPKEYTSTVILQLTEGYSPVNLPESIKMSSPDGGIVFTLLASYVNNALQYRVTLKLTKYHFVDDEYGDIRRLYGEISRIITTPVELKKDESK
jgi:hypothetical protein